MPNAIPSAACTPGVRKAHAFSRNPPCLTSIILAGRVALPELLPGSNALRATRGTDRAFLGKGLASRPPIGIARILHM